MPSNGTVNLVVNAAGGNDNINVSAPSFAGTPAINGGDGDDIIVGTALVDAIDGGEGNDRITAFRGNETILGGNGNDVIDLEQRRRQRHQPGGGGVDETLITEGNADDVNAITPERRDRALRAHRTPPFTVDSNDDGEADARRPSRATTRSRRAPA